MRPENKNMPDFDRLDDRIIMESPSMPSLVIKTNLDPQDSTENNPYFHGHENKDSKKFRAFFEE